ncbi:MAG: histidinol dehydrogenase, partial [Calditrichales bacterium]
QPFDKIDQVIVPILRDVRAGGDSAVIKYTRQFDGVDISSLVVKPDEIQNAESEISSGLKESIQKAIKNIRRFHQDQLGTTRVVETVPGVRCWRKDVPIEKVGLYIPGGSAPLFSSVLMLGIPAAVAGCREVILCTPPNSNGQIHAAIRYAAAQVGISRIFKAGGAQAIAAMAYGTESIPRVYKIFGPGNQYVTAAKIRVSMEGTAIDMPAGPSEVLVLADHTANPAFIAADLLSQAEHGPDSQVLMITTEKRLLKEVHSEMQTQLQTLPRRDIAETSLAHSKLILVKSLSEGIDMVNEYAPEHLILSVDQPESVADKVINAGSVFLGNYTPESAGDYASGTNHVLATNGYARVFSGVSVESFVKKITFQQITPSGLREIGPTIETMAAAEELNAHEKAVTLRLAHIAGENDGNR